MKTKKKFLTTKKATEKIVKESSRRFQKSWGAVKRTWAIIRRNETGFYPDVTLEFVNGYTFHPGHSTYDAVRYDRFGRTKNPKPEVELRRRLDHMPFDRSFDGGFTLCHATGYEVCFGNPNNHADWWNEYEDLDGNLEYGR